MDPMDLPTDNLYKFMALSGLFIAGLSIWYWWTWRREFLKENTALQIEHATLTRENNNLLQYKERQEKRSAHVTENLQRLHEDFAMLHKAPKEARNQEIKQLIASNQTELAMADAKRLESVESEEQLLSNLNEADIKLASLDLTARRQKSEGEELASLQKIAGYVVLGGLLLSASGFLLWYFKAQRFQDEATLFALREQKAKTFLAELDLETKRKAPPASSAAAPSPGSAAPSSAGPTPPSASPPASPPPPSASRLGGATSTALPSATSPAP